jgi:FlaG/FlaF family flagellin (archaellin)
MDSTTVTTVETAPAPRGATRQDRISEIIVIIVTLAALLAGTLLRTQVEGETKSVQADGVTLSYPANWQVSTASGETGVTTVRDNAAMGYPTTFEYRKVTVDASAPVTETLAQVANSFSINRAQNLSNFKVLSTESGKDESGNDLTVKGLPAYKLHYVFVHTPGSIQRATMPVVVMGDDYLVQKGDSVYIFSMQTTEENRPTALQKFDSFVNSAQLP